MCGKNERSRYGRKISGVTKGGRGVPLAPGGTFMEAALWGLL